MTPMTINAYANFGMVEIVFPAAILQPPFFDPHADPAINYGGIGAVIGHEISHHFDDQGAKYDAERPSRRLVDARPTSPSVQAAVTTLMASNMTRMRSFPGAHVKGEFTLGENIGDLAGLTIAYDAYQARRSAAQQAPVIDGTTGDQRFYLGWAQVWRRNYREANLRQRLLTDPHAPSRAARRGRPQPRPLVSGVQRPAGAETVPRAAGPGAHLVRPMLHRQLAAIDAAPLTGGMRWLLPALVAAAAISGGVAAVDGG